MIKNVFFIRLALVFSSIGLHTICSGQKIYVIRANLESYKKNEAQPLFYDLTGVSSTNGGTLKLSNSVNIHTTHSSHPSTVNKKDIDENVFQVYTVGEADRKMAGLRTIISGVRSDASSGLQDLREELLDFIDIAVSTMDPGTAEVLHKKIAVIEDKVDMLESNIEAEFKRSLLEDESFVNELKELLEE